MPFLFDISKDIETLNDSCRNTVKAFLLFASEHSSRITKNQRPAIAYTYNSKVTTGIINDKARSGHQHARVAFYRNGNLTEVKKLLGFPVENIIFLRFQFYEGGRLIDLHPGFFSTKNNISFAMNAIRKLRHSFLLNLGVSEEIIDANYGHSSIGTVALSPQSSLTLSDIERELAIPSAIFTRLIKEIIND